MPEEKEPKVIRYKGYRVIRLPSGGWWAMRPSGQLVGGFVQERYVITFWTRRQATDAVNMDLKG